MTQEWWGIYDRETETWRTENQTSNFDAFVGKPVYYPSRSIAEAHLSMIVQYLDPKHAERFTVRRFE